MGESKQKRTRVRRFIEEHPWCCYCGGETPATTIDHLPPRQMFLLKHRPIGGEVPACAHCNSKTAGHEQVAAFLARMYPDAKGEMAQKELEKIMKGIRNNIPGLLEELQPSWRQQYDFKAAHGQIPPNTNPMNANGPLLNRSIRIFAAKFGFAYHYLHTGNVIPTSGGVAVRWFSNYQRLIDDMPNLGDLFRNRATLSQGSKSVADQFEYSYAITEDKKASAYFAYFRQAFALGAFVSSDMDLFSDVDKIPAEDIYRPGLIQTPN